MIFLLMLGAVFESSQSLYEGRRYTLSSVTTRSFAHLSRRVVVFFGPQRKDGRVGNHMGHHLSWVRFFGLHFLDPCLFSMVAQRYLFRDKKFELDQLVKLGYTDFLVRQTASVSLENEEKDKFPEKYGIILSHRGDIHRRALFPLPNRHSWELCHGNLFTYMSRSWALAYTAEQARENLALTQKNLALNRGVRCSKLHTDLGFSLTYRVQALSAKNLENPLRHRVVSGEKDPSSQGNAAHARSFLIV